MTEGKFISYLRVSTDKQGKSGLGIEAQRQAVERYLNGGRWTIAAEYIETESGRRSDRPKLKAALAHAKAIKAKLVFAKLDRLTRNVDLLRSLVASDVDLVFCDLTECSSRAYGTLPAYADGRRSGVGGGLDRGAHQERASCRKGPRREVG
jgi:hypothetical protein